MKPETILQKQMTEMARGVNEFQTKVLEIEPPRPPARLPVSRKLFRTNFLQEELNEFRAADAFVDEVDALVDLVYVAIGALLEMGVDPLRAFDPVQDANMNKMRGVTKRGDSIDATKPEGWTPPDHERVLQDLAIRCAVPPAMIEATKVLIERAAAYNHGEDVRREDHFPFGMTSIFSLMWVKIKRMEADLRAGRRVKRDHLVDLINYSSFGVDLLDGRRM